MGADAVAGDMKLVRIIKSVVLKIFQITLFVYSFCCCNWLLEHPVLSQSLSSIAVLDSQNIWVAGAEGIIIKYDGVAWSSQRTISDCFIRAISFSDSANGWVVGNTTGAPPGNGLILKYSNSTWKIDSFAFKQGLRKLNSVYSLKPNQAWIAGDSNVLFHFNGTDWQPFGTPFKDTMVTITSFHFLDSSHGWAAGVYVDLRHESALMKYDGAAWSKLQGPDSTMTGSYFYIGYPSIFFADTSHGWLAPGMASGLIHKYVHGKWSNDTVLPGGHYVITDIAFTDSIHGWATAVLPIDCDCEYPSDIYRHDESGWHPCSTRANPLYKIKMLNANYGFAVGETGSLLKYADGGWQPVLHPTYNIVKHIQMLDASNGWAVTANRLLKYDGIMWQDDSVNDSIDWNVFSFSDKNHGLLGGEKGRIKRYYYGTWSDEVTPDSNSLTALFLLDSNHGWAGTQQGRLWKYNGQAWLMDTISLSDKLTGIRFTDSAHGVVATGSGNVYKYVQGVTIRVPPKINLNSYTQIFLDSAYPERGYVTNGERLYAFIDDSLTPVTVDDMGIISEGFDFKSINNGWSIGEGTLRHYNGLYWDENKLPSGSWYYSVSFLDSLHGWIGGNYGKIYRTDDGGISFVETSCSDNRMAETLKITPNPFNPSTHINFLLTTPKAVKLVVFNISGKKIATLADRTLPVGRHSVNFDANGLASGVYLCRLTAGTRVNTKRLVLMR